MRTRRATTWRPGRDPRAQRHAPEFLLGPAPQVVTPEGSPRVVVGGGGIAGMASAAVLAEAGVQVTLLEREDTLGGRVRSWPVSDDATDTGGFAAGVAADASGTTPRTMSRGFHAFFRQYYNLRGLLRRADPDLSALIPVADYPLVGPDGQRDSFTGIPRTPPFSVAAFAWRSESFTAREVARVNVPRALKLLTVDFPGSFEDYDDMSAAEVLDRLDFPPAARHLALEVFARSFFADPREFSGAELVAMFHAYFLGSAEGLLFDVPRGDYDRVLWAPLGHYLWRQGVQTRVGCTVTAVEEVDGIHGPVRVVAQRGGETTSFEADAVVLATDLAPLQRLVLDATWLGDPAWRERIELLRRAPRFAVWRLWLDTPVAEGTPPFLGTAGLGLLDNVSAVHLFEEEAAAWARATGGSVVELHAYALAPDAREEEVQRDLLRRLHHLHPELRDARAVAQEWLVEEDCGLITPEPWGERPSVESPDPRVVLAGDGIRVDLPVALMERAATTGMLAASALLRRWGRSGPPVWSVPMTGSLAPRRFTGRR